MAEQSEVGKQGRRGGAGQAAQQTALQCGDRRGREAGEATASGPRLQILAMRRQLRDAARPRTAGARRPPRRHPAGSWRQRAWRGRSGRTPRPTAATGETDRAWCDRGEPSRCLRRCRRTTTARRKPAGLRSPAATRRPAPRTARRSDSSSGRDSDVVAAETFVDRARRGRDAGEFLGREDVGLHGAPRSTDGARE